ncbi:MAG TPA: 6-phosphofructokinase [Sandaracinaceae bacterium LLY-WYZ-13_1]|nr:6-phosphofructokinase [Sandaracinaceae bacterium LLY-WYZ-13_1]
MPIGVLTSGGDAPGMNAAVRAVVKVAAGRGVHVLGVERGYQGLLERRFADLTRETSSTASGLAPTREVELSANLGGSFLGTARCKAFYEAEGRAEAARVVRDQLDGLVVIGGNGSLTGAHALASDHGCAVVGVPASIDHDIGCTNTAIGVDTALNTIVEACDRISDTARAHRRAFVVEVMGRQSGYLCMAGAVAAGADAALFREQGRDEAALVGDVAALIERSFSEDRDKQRVLIMKAEGVEIPCTKLVRMVTERLGDALGDVSVRATVLGHLVRGGNPSFGDRMVANRFGHAAVNALLEGKRDVMTAWQPPVAGGEPTVDHGVRLFELSRVLEETAAMLDGSSPVTRGRVALMEKAAGVLAL